MKKKRAERKKAKSRKTANSQMTRVRQERAKLANMQNLLLDLDKMVQGLTITDLSQIKRPDSVPTKYIWVKISV